MSEDVRHLNATSSVWASARRSRGSRAFTNVRMACSVIASGAFFGESASGLRVLAMDRISCMRAVR
jgi:hypothetical protein